MGICDRLDENRWWDCLKDIILRNTGENGSFQTDIRGVMFHRHTLPEMPVSHFLRPLLIVMVQGTKYVRIGSEDFSYSARDCFVTALDMPVSSCVMEASPEMPYLSISIELDMEVMASFAAKIPIREKTGWNPSMGVMTHKVEARLLDALLRLAELSEDRNSIAGMEDIALKEIYFLLFQSKSGKVLQNLCSLNFSASQIAKLVAWLKNNYKSSFSILDISKEFAMSPSTLFKYFKEVTSLSPIQYQKMLRLCEAKRLLEIGNYKISELSKEVGYESSTQFSREYKRLFGCTPKKQKCAIHSTCSSHFSLSKSLIAKP